jgi:hypothetical protein
MSLRGFVTTVAVGLPLAAVLLADRLTSYRRTIGLGLLAVAVFLVAASLRGFGRRSRILGSSPTVWLAFGAAFSVIGVDLLWPARNIGMPGFGLLLAAVLLDIWQNRRRQGSGTH